MVIILLHYIKVRKSSSKYFYLGQICDRSDLHTGIQAAFDELKQIDPKKCVKKAHLTLSPEKLEKIVLALSAQEESRVPVDEDIDTRAVSQVLKSIQNVEMNHVLYNTLLCHPLVKNSKAPAPKKHTKGGLRKKNLPRFNYPEQVCRMINQGVHNGCIQTVLVGLKALLYMYETTSVDASAFPESERCLQTLLDLKLLNWEDYLEILAVEEDAERAARATGKTIKRIVFDVCR